MILALLVHRLLVLRAGCFGFVFRVSSVLCFGCHVVSSCFFGETLLRDVTGKALLCSAVVEFVAPWCYGFGTVLDFFRWLVLRRASSGPARVGGRGCESGKRSFEEFQRVQRFKRARERTQRVVLNCPGLDIAHRRLVQSERRYGTEPRLHGCSCKALSCDEKITFYPCIKTLTRFTHL